jgi:pyrroline-5-carboxylate reductase
MSLELAIIGAGNMAEAIVRGVLRAGLFDSTQMAAVDVSRQRRELFEQQLQVRCSEQMEPVVQQARRILLSVKPQQMGEVLPAVGTAAVGDPLIISIAAGTRTGFIEQHLGGNRKWRVVRTMPNTPMLVGLGVVGIAPGSHATAADLDDVSRIFASSATVVQVTEDKLDAVTAVSGSGPAYFFYMVEHMIQAGIELGLTPEQAHTLATGTAQGAAAMLVTSDNPPAELRRKVTSPGGTTEAATRHLEREDWGETLKNAIKAAERRSREL